MSDLTDLLASTGQRLEPEIQRRLQGLLGSMMRAYLPQSWEFRTEDGRATLTVDQDGRTSATDGSPAHPDVTIEVPLATLRTALTTRSKDAAAPGTVHVTPHTAKGRAAFEYLRGRLGL